MKKPNFFLVGTAKSGTTTLHNALNQHPEIFMSHIKEPCYFSEGGPQWINSEEEYLALFSNVNHELAIGESSTTYLDDDSTAEKLYEFTSGQGKIIIILRNPADRALSQWEHYYHHEMIETLSFEEALKNETVRLENMESLKKETYFRPQLFLYFRQGLYSDKVKRYIDRFGRENVLVLVFEEFIQDKDSYLKTIYEFLGVTSDFVPQITTENSSRMARLSFLSRILQSPPPLLYNVYHRLPQSLQETIFKTMRALYWLNQKPRHKTAMDEKLRAKLLSDYLNDIHQLEALLNRDFSLWYQV